MSAITDSLANAFGYQRRTSSPVLGSTWRIGTVASEGSDVGLFWCPSLHDEGDVADVMAALVREVRTPFRLILSAGGNLRLPNAETAAPMDVTEFEPATPGLSATVDPRDIVEAPRKNPGGALNRCAQLVVPLVEARMQDGTAKVGRNAEAKAILTILKAEKPGARVPSLSSIQDYVTKVRAGQ